MKKLINEIDNVVDEMLDGMAAAYPQYVKRLEGMDVLVRAGGSAGKVALVSGGGSGHEPAHGGYVGKGMLDGAVAGAVFTSPTPDQVYEAIMAANGGKGRYARNGLDVYPFLFQQSEYVNISAVKHGITKCEEGHIFSGLQKRDDFLFIGFPELLAVLGKILYHGKDLINNFYPIL